MKKILLIEDDPDVASTLESVFATFLPQSRLVNIKSGEEFSQGAWKSQRWDFIILDLMLPGITGFDICHALRNHTDTKDSPILALTGYDTRENRERILLAGASAYLSKPFEVGDFVDLLRRYMGPLDKEGGPNTRALT